jgi:hypothetical protein
VGDHVALSPDPHSLSRTLRSTRHNESADLGVKSHEFLFVGRHRDDLAIADDLVLPMKA